MLNPVTPWSATVHDDLQNSEPLFSKKLFSYSIEFFNSGDSLWLTVQWPVGGRIAFRIAFGMNSVFEKTSVAEIGGGVLVTAKTRLGSYRIAVAFFEGDQPILRYTTTFRAGFEMLIPFWPRDIVPLTKAGEVENTAGKIHTHQEGGRSGQLFFSYTRPKTGSVFYFQNLTAMSDYCQASESSVVDSVGGEWPEIGFQFPINKDKPLPAGREFTISDAFVAFSDKTLEDHFEITRQYLEHLASVYVLLPKPEVKYNDWPAIAKKTLDGLDYNKGCWQQAEGTAYLNAYLCDYKTPAEIMVQLAVLLPLQEYLEWAGKKHRIFDELNSGLEAFYDESVKTIVRWHPALEDSLDNSEEQKQRMVMDSWYLHHPMLNLARLAVKGDKKAEKLFLNSIDYVIKVAHHFKYDWPVFYRMTTLEVIKAETHPGQGGEKDVPGSYAHIMLMAWQLTSEVRYLNEAKKAVKNLCGLGFDIFYQANNTGFTAAALIELYHQTNDEEYLELSYCCLAGIFRNMQIWDCQYGLSKSFPNFFAVFPLNDAPYTAAYEELEVYAALTHYMQLVEKDKIPRALKILIPEFIKYATGRMAYYFPPMLSPEMIAEEVKTGEIQNDLWIPLEDIYDGWEKNGQVGQEVYGAGIGFGVVSRQYYKLKGTDAVIFVDYPVSGFRNMARSATFKTLGDPSLECSLRILNAPKARLAKFTVEIKTQNQYIAVKSSSNRFAVRGGSLIRLRWH